MRISTRRARLLRDAIRYAQSEAGKARMLMVDGYHDLWYRAYERTRLRSKPGHALPNDRRDD